MSCERPMRERERGFTLIELMISLVLFSIAVAGVLSVAVSITNGYRQQRQAIAAESAVRVPLDFIADALRQASPAVTDPEKVWDRATCHQGAIRMSNGGATPAFPGASTAPDVLDVIYAAGAVVTSVTADFAYNATSMAVRDGSQFAVDDYVLVSDLTSGLLMKITAVAGNNLTLAANGCGGAPPAGLSANFPIGSLVIRAQHARFSVGTVNGVSTLMMDSDGVAADGVTAFGNPPEPLAEGIEDMQIALGVDTTPGGGLLDANSNADEWFGNVGTDGIPAWSQIRAVRVTLIAITANPLPGPGTFYRPAAEDRAASGTPDGYRRRTLQSIVEIRNLGGSP